MYINPHLYVPVESAIDLQCELTRERGRREQAEELLREADEWLRLAGFIPEDKGRRDIAAFLAARSQVNPQRSQP